MLQSSRSIYTTLAKSLESVFGDPNHPLQNWQAPHTESFKALTHGNKTISCSYMTPRRQWKEALICCYDDRKVFIRDAVSNDIFLKLRLPATTDDTHSLFTYFDDSFIIARNNNNHRGDTVQCEFDCYRFARDDSVISTKTVLSESAFSFAENCESRIQFLNPKIFIAPFVRTGSDESAKLRSYNIHDGTYGPPLAEIDREVCWYVADNRLMLLTDDLRLSVIELVYMNNHLEIGRIKRKTRPIICLKQSFAWHGYNRRMIFSISLIRHNMQKTMLVSSYMKRKSGLTGSPILVIHAKIAKMHGGFWDKLMFTDRIGTRFLIEWEEMHKMLDL